MDSSFSVKDRLLRAKIGLQKTHPFFGHLLVRLPLKEFSKEELGLGPVGTDGYILAYDPNDEWLKSLSDEQVEFVVCHEVMHCALDHIKGDRIGGRDRVLWNFAVDYVTNYILSASGLKRPPDVLYNEDFKDKCAEEVYDLLNKNRKKFGLGGKLKPGSGKGQGQSQAGDMKTLDAHLDPGSKSGKAGKHKGQMSEAERQKHREEWARAFADAAVFAQQRGSLPAGLARMVDSLLNRTASWASMLWKFLEKVAGYDDFTYSRPSRRTWPAGYYIPARLADKIEVAIGIDTSGSISQALLVEFLSELQAFREKFTRAHLTIYPIDADLYEHFEVSPDEDLVDCATDMLKGGGGTDFNPLFEYFENDEDATTPKCLVFLTDGYAAYPEEGPEFDVVWLVYGGLGENNTPPFGEVVEMSEYEDE